MRKSFINHQNYYNQALTASGFKQNIKYIIKLKTYITQMELNETVSHNKKKSNNQNLKNSNNNKLLKS